MFWNGDNKFITSQNFLYISKISLAIWVPVTIGRSLTFLSTDLLRKTSFLSFFCLSPPSFEFALKICLVYLCLDMIYLNMINLFNLPWVCLVSLVSLPFTQSCSWRTLSVCESGWRTSSSFHLCLILSLNDLISLILRQSFTFSVSISCLLIFNSKLWIVD